MINQKLDSIQSKFYGYILRMRAFMVEIYEAVKVTCQGRGRYRQVNKGFYDLDVEEPVDQLFHVGEAEDGDGPDHMDDGDDLIEVKVMSLDGEPLVTDQRRKVNFSV
jgi:hypothetical protein